MATPNKYNKITRYKVQLVAQIPDIDYENTYSLVMDTVTFRFLICLAILERLDMHLMDVVTTYLYGSLDTNIYMKIPKGFKMLEAYKSKLQRSLYGFKQSGRMWYNCFE